MAIRTVQTPKSREAGLKKKKQKAQNKTHSSKSLMKDERRKSVKYTTPGQLNRILKEE